MEPIISFDIPEQFTVGETQEFTITTTANLEAGTIVRGYGSITALDASDASDIIEKAEYLEVEDGNWYELPDDFSFGPEEGFPLMDITANFRISFKEAGEYRLVFKIVSVSDGATITENSTLIEIVEPEVDPDTPSDDEEPTEEGTPYMDIYESFLSTITDDRIALLTEEELQVEFLPLLKRAIYFLCRIARVPGYDLHDRDDINYRFTQKLGDHEIECLAFAMTVAWTEQQLNSSRLIQQQYWDAGIKTYSPNELMKNLIDLHDSYYKKLKNRLTEYGYKTVDIRQFGGNGSSEPSSTPWYERVERK